MKEIDEEHLKIKIDKAFEQIAILQDLTSYDEFEKVLIEIELHAKTVGYELAVEEKIIELKKQLKEDQNEKIKS